MATLRIYKDGRFYESHYVPDGHNYEYTFNGVTLCGNINEHDRIDITTGTRRDPDRNAYSDLDLNPLHALRDTASEVVDTVKDTVRGLFG